MSTQKATVQLVEKTNTSTQKAVAQLIGLESTNPAAHQYLCLNIETICKKLYIEEARKNWEYMPEDDEKHEAYFVDKSANRCMARYMGIPAIEDVNFFFVVERNHEYAVLFAFHDFESGFVPCEVAIGRKVSFIMEDFKEFMLDPTFGIL